MENRRSRLLGEGVQQLLRQLHECLLLMLLHCLYQTEAVAVHFAFYACLQPKHVLANAGFEVAASVFQRKAADLQTPNASILELDHLRLHFVDGQLRFGTVRTSMDLY